MEIRQIPIDKIQRYPLNNKIHPEHQIKALAASIGQVGFLKPLILDEDLVLLAGEGAFLAGIEAGFTTLPCVIHSDLTERKKMAYRIADNKLAEGSQWDFDKTATEISRLVEMDFDIGTIGFNEQELDAFLKSIPSISPVEKEPDVIPVASHNRTVSKGSKVKKVSRIGDVWTMGGMTLTCVDSDSVADCDWLIRRWQTKTKTVAVHESGMDFNKLEDARNK